MNLKKVTGYIVLSRTRAQQSVSDPVQDNRNFYSAWHAISLAFIDKDFGPLTACVIIYKKYTENPCLSREADTLT